MRFVAIIDNIVVILWFTPSSWHLVELIIIECQLFTQHIMYKAESFAIRIISLFTKTISYSPVSNI